MRMENPEENPGKHRTTHVQMRRQSALGVLLVVILVLLQAVHVLSRGAVMPCAPNRVCICAAGKYVAGASVCVECEAGKHAASAGSVICTICPTGKTSAAGSVSENDCNMVRGSDSTTQVVLTEKVRMVVFLPVRAAEFDSKKQQSFKEAIAKTACPTVKADHVVIDTIEERTLEPRCAHCGTRECGEQERSFVHRCKTHQRQHLHQR